MKPAIGLGLFLVVLFLISRLMIQQRNKRFRKQQDKKNTEIER